MRGGSHEVGADDPEGTRYTLTFPLHPKQADQRAEDDECEDDPDPHSEQRDGPPEAVQGGNR